jgi:hypothetical protein
MSSLLYINIGRGGGNRTIDILYSYDDLETPNQGESRTSDGTPESARLFDIASEDGLFYQPDMSIISRR